MNKTWATLISLLVVLGALVWGVSQASAQNPSSVTSCTAGATCSPAVKNAASNTPNAGNANAQPLGPPAGCKPGQLRCMNNKHRLAAAAGNADRRAKAMRAAQAKQGEVK
jgi:hypothetical protein